MNSIPNLLQQKLLVILQRCFVEIRNLALIQSCDQMHDLADTVEFVPALMMRWEDGHLNLIRDAFMAYKSRHEGAYDYLSILNMDDQAFQSTFVDFEAAWRQCEAENQRITATDPAA